MKEQEEKELLEEITGSEYKYGFTSDFDTDEAPKGLNEDIIRLISTKKNEPAWLLEWRLDAYAKWQTMTEPKWPNVKYPKIDFQDCWKSRTKTDQTLTTCTILELVDVIYSKLFFLFFF